MNNFPRSKLYRLQDCLRIDRRRKAGRSLPGERFFQANLVPAKGISGESLNLALEYGPSLERLNWTDKARACLLADALTTGNESDREEARLDLRHNPRLCRLVSGLDRQGLHSVIALVAGEAVDSSERDWWVFTNPEAAARFRLIEQCWFEAERVRRCIRAREYRRRLAAAVKIAKPAAISTWEWQRQRAELIGRVQRAGRLSRPCGERLVWLAEFGRRDGAGNFVRRSDAAEWKHAVSRLDGHGDVLAELCALAWPVPMPDAADEAESLTQEWAARSEIACLGGE